MTAAADETVAEGALQERASMSLQENSNKSFNKEIKSKKVIKAFIAVWLLLKRDDPSLPTVGAYLYPSLFSDINSIGYF